MSQKKNEQKKTYHTSERTTLSRLCAFIALLATAICQFAGAFLVKWGGSIGATITQILNLISIYSLLIAIAFPAWYFVRGRGKAWRVVYWVFLALYILAVILGFTFNFI